MPELIVNTKRKILRILFGTLSFSTALFVFQACYGTNKDFGRDVLIKGCVKSKVTDKPLAGIKISISNMPQFVYTDSLGQFEMFSSENYECKLVFEDTVSTSKLQPIDTTIYIKKTVPFLNIFLHEK